MRNVAICGSGVKNLMPDNRSLAALEIEGVGMTCGVIITREPRFDPHAPENRFNVLLKVKGFSCNFRDLNFIFAAARKGAENSFFAVGSDFTGEVLEVGAGVTRLKVGDRVIPDNHYTGAGAGRVPEGVLTNQASKEYRVAHEDKLAKIPGEMPDDVAAAFSIGAQTVYSMLRKLDLKAGGKILVTAAKSNSSLFAISALRRRGVDVYATSTSPSFEQELKASGVRELIQIDPQIVNFLVNERVREIVSQVGMFDYVFDPFFDLHFPKVLDIIAPNGKYITCGFHNQYQPPGAAEAARKPDLTQVLLPVLTKNLQVIGNCIGLTEDLNDALRDYASGSFRVPIDSVFRGDDVGHFFDRTYNARDRFGKVVYLYD